MNMASSTRVARACALALLMASGCGPVETSSEQSGPGTLAQELEGENSITTNGLAFNGLAFNGLTTNGLLSAAFTTWFQQNPPLANMVMKYVVQCAVPAGETRTYSDGTQTYTWTGRLGLTPNWAGGQPATRLEQQLISACLAAHTNKFGRTVAISILGTDARGHPIPSTSEELQQFSATEGCFFGNLFTGEGIFAGNDRNMFNRNESGSRVCALDKNKDGTTPVCAPFVHIGSCSYSCDKDETKTYYTSCTHNGRTYVPIVTRVRPQELYKCGDGICQFTESCGTGRVTNDCGLDCGPCP